MRNTSTSYKEVWFVIVKIVGHENIKAGGNVIVEFINGKVVTYEPSKTETLILNPGQIKSITIAKE
jgi:archaellum component FlaG (FlaF/FlaG flagellin family)